MRWRITKVLIAGLIALIGLSGILAVFLPQQAVISFFWGGMVSIITDIIFSFWLFKETYPRALKRIISRFYKGELTKLLLISVLFVVSLKFLKIDVLFCLLGFLFAAMFFKILLLVWWIAKEGL